MEYKSKINHPVFVLSIVLLIVNDFYLKSIYHNQLTGKLSDFAGLFAFPFFISSFYPKKSKLIHFLVAVLFVFWKSELSQPIIYFLNNIGFNLHRVVDFSDNIALVSIIVSYFLFNKLTFLNTKPIIIKVIMGVSLFSFVATTQKREFREPTYEDGFKKISLLNLYNEPVTAIINFKYSKKELANDTSLNNKFNRLDTISIKNMENYEFITPIKYGDSIKFPMEFKIIILDTLGKSLFNYNKQAFIKSTQNYVYNKNKSVSEFSENWDLTIKHNDLFNMTILYGAWSLVGGAKKGKYYDFEIRKDHYYNLTPRDAEVVKYSVNDSVITLQFLKGDIKFKVMAIDSSNLTLKWQGKDIVKYKKMYN